MLPGLGKAEIFHPFNCHPFPKPCSVITQQMMLTCALYKYKVLGDLRRRSVEIDSKAVEQLEQLMLG